MEIISVSLDQKLVQAMDQLIETEGYSGRSDIIRASLRAMISEKRQRDGLQGELKAILIATHEKKSEDLITRTKHAFEDVIDLQMHYNTATEKCIEIFILYGKSERIKMLVKAIGNKVETAKLILP